jgi:AsmA-like C-terminal region
MRLKAAAWVTAAVVGTLVVLTVVAAAGSRTEPLRKLVIATLEERLDSHVELKAFSVDLFPAVTVQGTGLTVRLRTVTDSSAPPLIQIESFTVHCGLIDLLRRPRHFKHVTLAGLVVSIPPGGLKKHGNPITQAAGRSPSSGNTPAPLAPPDPGASGSGGSGPSPKKSPIIVDELLADGALLRIVPRREGKAPKEFAIHALTMRSLGIAEKMPFTATLTNPLPKGQIETSGTFGPWQKDDPGATPLEGIYTFQNADLGTIKGIGGKLSSKGAFGGELGRISVKGETHVPDFHLTISNQPVALSASFEAVVDGTDGDTYLNEVNAQFGHTSLSAKGAVTGTKGVKGRNVKLAVHIQEGRIEDLLRLAVKGDKPLLVGRVALRTDFELPPGDRDVIEKLQLAGTFDVDAAKFTDDGVQKKLSGMSHRARGRDPDAPADQVVSDLRGRFRLKDGSLSFTDLTFGLPGALVRLHGSYGLRSEAIAFDGTLRMDATISEAAGGGIKGFLLKAIDPIFRKKGAGALVPIKIGGTRDKPQFGLDVGKAFKK